MKATAYSRTEAEGVTNYAYSAGGRVLMEEQPLSGTRSSFIYALGKQIARVEGIVGDAAEKVYYYHDNLGSVRMMTDESGDVRWEQDYMPFGDDLPLPGMALREWDADPAYKYTGQRQVAGIGLYYYGARFYDPELGRFITEDTYAGALGDAQTQNRYCYVLNNPMRYTDPDGHKAQDYQVDNASDWRLVLGIENVDPEWEFSNYGDYIYCNSAGQYLHSRVTKVDGSTRIVNTYLTANGHFDHQEIKIYDLGSSQPRIYDDYVLAELTQQMLAQNLPKVAGSVALLIATTLCEPLDWGVTIYGWTQGGFSYWDLIGLAPGISAQMVDKVSDGAKVVMRVFRASDGYVDDVAEVISEAKRVVNAAEGAGEVKLGRLNYKPTSGVDLVTTPGKTTTVLGTYAKDTGSIVNELGNVKSTNFGPRQNGFNVLNVPDELYQNPKQFWNEFNQPWLDNAIARNDNILMATKPEFKVGSLFRKNSSGRLELSGFGKEYSYLRKNGYVFDPTINQ